MNVPVFLLFLTLKERLAIRLQKQISRTNIEFCLVKFCVSNIGQVYWQTDWQTLLWSEKLTLTFFTTCLQHNICAFGIDMDFPYSYSNNAEVQHTECHRPKYTMSRYTSSALKALKAFVVKLFIIIPWGSGLEQVLSTPC